MPQRKRLSKDARRIQLLDAAAKLSCKSSYGQVTTADLAKVAGAIRAAEWIIGKPAGLYTMTQVLGL